MWPVWRNIWQTTVKNQHVIVVMTYSIEEQIQEFKYINSMDMIMMVKKERMIKPKAKPNSKSVKRKRDFNYYDLTKDENNIWKDKRRKNCSRLAQAQIPMPTDIQKNGKWLMRIGLKYQGMVVVTMMFGKPIPIIGFLMKGDSGIAPGTVKQRLYLKRKFIWHN